MKKYALLYLSFFTINLVSAQNYTDISLMWKDTNKQESSISSESGNLYKKLNHHGPAIENEFLGLRIYFDYKCAIDVYNKSKTGLELADAAWYPTPKQQSEGWGSDQYKVGATVGLGGVRLWDGEKVVFLNPVSKRTARVVKEINSSYMEMLSEGIPYKGDSIDILVRVSVYSGSRAAKVEAFALCDRPVQFLTGINFHKGMKTIKKNHYIATWGIHPEDVAAIQIEIGAGLIYNPDDFESVIKQEKEYQLISKPTKYLSTKISSTCEQEDDLNNMKKFTTYLNRL